MGAPHKDFKRQLQALSLNTGTTQAEKSPLMQRGAVAGKGKCILFNTTKLLMRYDRLPCKLPTATKGFIHGDQIQQHLHIALRQLRADN